MNARIDKHPGASPLVDAVYHLSQWVHDADAEGLADLRDRAALLNSTNCGWAEFAVRQIVRDLVQGELFRRKRDPSFRESRES